MSFVNPFFLFALSAIAIPIIIHLFNFRRYKVVYFTNVKFLKEVQEETESKSKLKHLLVLLSRILAITFLALAFAQPYIPNNNQKASIGEQAVSVYLDNSFSMDAVGKSGPLLDEAKKYATEIAKAYKPSDRFQLLTNDFEAKHQRLVTREEFIQLLDEIKLSPNFRDLQQISSRQAEALNTYKAKNKTAFILSDFQKSITNGSQIKSDTAIQYKLIPLIAETKNNVYIDSCWFSVPIHKANQVEQLYVRIKNISDNDYPNVPLKLFINEQQKTPASFSIAANSTIDTVLAFSVKDAGIQNGRIELNDYPVTFDDKFYFSYNVPKNIKLLCINGTDKSKITTENSFIKSLFAKDSVIQLTNTEDTKIDYSTLPSYSFIIANELATISSGLAQELQKFTNNGGTLIVFPSTQTDVKSYNEFLNSLSISGYTSIDTANTKVNKINYSADIYKGVFEKRSDNVDLPKVFSYYVIGKSVRSTEEKIMELINGNSFLSLYHYGKGSVYLSAVPLDADWSNFTKHAIFVPTLYQAALYSIPSGNLFYIIGKNEAVEITNTQTKTENILKIKSSTSKNEVIPEIKMIESKTVIYAHDQIKEPGNYFIDIDNDTLSGISFNYDRKESDLICMDAKGLQSYIETSNLSNFHLVNSIEQNITKALQEISEGKKLWSLCIVLVLVFLLTEVLLLRFLK